MSTWKIGVNQKYNRPKKTMKLTVGNYIKGWHKSIRLAFKCFRPAMSKFLFILHKEQQQTEEVLFKMIFW